MYVDIKMENMNDVKKINEFACGCDFDVFVSNSTSIIDAKSMLCLITMIGKKDLHLLFPDHIQFKNIEKAMKKSKLIEY